MIGLLPFSLSAQGVLDRPLPPDLAQAFAAWLSGRTEGIWETVSAAAQTGHPVAQKMLGAGLIEKDGWQGLAYDPAQALDW